MRERSVSSSKRDRSPSPVQHPQACRWERNPSSTAAVKSSVRHEVVSQILRGELAAFMPDNRVVLRTHGDEQCSVAVLRILTPTQDSVPWRGEMIVEDVPFLAGFTHLVSLCLNYGRVSAAVLARLTAEVPWIEAVELCECDFEEAGGLLELSKLPRLRHLDTGNCLDVDATWFSAIAQMTGLRRLLLAFCQVDATGLAQVWTLSQLQTLDMNNCRGVEAAGLSGIAQLTQLTHLDISECDGIDTASLAEVAKLTELQYVDVGTCRGVTAAGVAGILALPQLTHLGISGCCDVDAATLSVIAKLKKLRSLDLSACGVNAGATWLSEISSLTKLTHLDLCGCPLTVEAL